MALDEGKFRHIVASGRALCSRDGVTLLRGDLTLPRIWTAGSQHPATHQMMGYAMRFGCPATVALCSLNTRADLGHYADAVRFDCLGGADVRLLDALEPPGSKLNYDVIWMATSDEWRTSSSWQVDQVGHLLRMGCDPTAQFGGKSSLDNLRGNAGAVAEAVELLRENAIARGREHLPGDLGLYEIAIRDVLEFIFLDAPARNAQMETEFRARVAAGEPQATCDEAIDLKDLDHVRMWIAAGHRQPSFTTGVHKGSALSFGFPSMVAAFSLAVQVSPYAYAEVIVHPWWTVVDVRFLDTLRQKQPDNVLQLVTRCIRWETVVDSASVEQVRHLLRMGHDPTERICGTDSLDNMRDQVESPMTTEVLELLRENAIARGRECIPDDLGLCEAALRDVLEFMF